MNERLAALRSAITDLLYDPDLVTWGADSTYTVYRPGGGTFVVMRTEDGNWAVFHDHSTPERPRPKEGIPGTQSSYPEYAIAWVLADPWSLPRS